jgi:RNA polymerase sigma-70 factor (ECF subfamily)
VLVGRHRDRLWAVALRTLGDPDEAADALQDALVNAFRRAGSYRGDAEVTTWLHRVVVNACLDRVRHRQARPTAAWDEDAAARVPDRRDAVTDEVRRLDVADALAHLPAEQRAALVLVDLEGWSVADAAAMLGCAAGTVKSRCARGRAALRPLLAGYGPAPATAPPGNRSAPVDVPSPGVSDAPRDQPGGGPRGGP